MATLEFFVPSNNHDKRGNPAPLDGLNELVSAERGGWGNALKKRNGKNAEASCVYEMRAKGWKCPDVRCKVTLTFVETSKKRDPDNIYGGSKFILDGIIKPKGRKLFGAGAIADDSQKWIDLEFGPILVDKARPGCKVRIETIGEE
jgi:hypothetical protein